MTVQGRFRATLLGKCTNFSLSASRSVQGVDGTRWDKMDQVVLGAEYMFNGGFVPLVMPTVMADDGVRARTVIVGAKLDF